MTIYKDKALRKIYTDINNGYLYGYDDKRFHYLFWPDSGRLRGFEKIFQEKIIWNTMKDLYMLITEVYKTTPEMFLRVYIRNDESKFIDR